MQKRKRKSDEDDAQGGMGGRPVQPNDDGVVLLASIHDARLIRDLHNSGGSFKHIDARSWTLSDIARMNKAGFIDVVLPLVGRPLIQLNVRGVQALVSALKMIAADPGAGR